MRVTVEHFNERKTVKHGFFRDKVVVEHGYFVKVHVTLDDVECDTLDRHSLWDTSVYESPNYLYSHQMELYREQLADHANEKKMRPFLATFQATPRLPDKVIYNTITQFCSADGIVFSFNSPAYAKGFDEELRTTILPKMKNLITSNATPPTSKTYEL